jgi:hypothetical protein
LLYQNHFCIAFLLLRSFWDRQGDVTLKTDMALQIVFESLKFENGELFLIKYLNFLSHRHTWI